VSVNIQTSVVYITSIVGSNSFCHKKFVTPLVQNMTSVSQFDLNWKNIYVSCYKQGGSAVLMGSTECGRPGTGGGRTIWR
jgi:hypothetical protein